MYNSVEEVKVELKKLCEDYIKILDKMKKEKIITDDIYDECKLNKQKFLNHE